MSRQHHLTRYGTRYPTSAGRILGLVSVLCVAALIVAGCGAGQVTQTDTQVAAIDGASVNAQQAIALRDVLIPYPVGFDGVYPAGSDIPLLLTIANSGGRADRLVAVSSPVSQQVLIGGATTVPAQMSVASVVDDPAYGFPVPPPDPRFLDMLHFGQIAVVLTNIIRPVRAGENIEVTFRFENAGLTTASVPMALPPPALTREALEGAEH